MEKEMKIDKITTEVEGVIDLEELVEIKLFKDNDKYKDDVFVAVNGERCLIKRGERVNIKRKFANVLEQSDLQDTQTANMCDNLSDEYQNDVSRRL